MRIAAIDDLHGNLPALEAAIGKIRQQGVDRVVVGGDVLPGTMPVETLERSNNWRAGPTAVLEAHPRHSLDGRAASAGTPAISRGPAQNTRPRPAWKERRSRSEVVRPA
jgi:Icc-related predicted phosphoesterase